MFYSNIIYGLIAVFLLIKLLRKDFNLFHVLVFVLPFHSWVYKIGLALTINQIITVIMIVTVLVLSIYSKKNLLYFGNIYIVAFLFFAIVDTLIMSVFFIDDYLQLGGFFRSEGRFISQIILLIISFSVIPLAFNYIKSVQDVQKYLKIYLYALIVLTVLGWIQYFTYITAGFDLFPLAIDQYGTIRTGMYGYEGMNIFRMSSLGGEPKGFSMSLVMGFFMIHIFNRYDIRFFKNDVALKYLFLFTAFATLSTSSMVLFVILFFVYVLYIIGKSEKLFKLKSQNVFYSFIIMSSILFLLFKYWDFVSSIIEQRVFARDLLNDDYDAPIKIFLSKFPEYLLFGSGLGNIHNLAYPYIPSQYMHYMNNTIFVAKSGYLKIISELGFIGLSFLLFMFYNAYNRLGKIRKKVMKEEKHIFSALQLLLVITMIAYFARVYLDGELFLFLAIVNVIGYSKSVHEKRFR